MIVADFRLIKKISIKIHHQTKKSGVNRILMDLIGVKNSTNPKKIKSVQKFHHQTKKIGVNRV